MENKEIIQKIAEARYQSTYEYDSVRYDDQYCGFKREALRQALTLLAPFIPEWRSAREEMPERGELVVCKWHPDLNKAVTYGMFVDLDGYFLAGVIEWMRLPSTTHPYEQLLNKLKNIGDGK